VTPTDVTENPVKLLECLPKCTSLPKERHRWNTNEEIAAYLITFEKHEEWLTTSPKTRPQNGSMILYNRKKVKYRKDGYCWKKRKDGKTTREDHMKLKVQGVEERCPSAIISPQPTRPETFAWAKFHKALVPPLLTDMSYLLRFGTASVF
uniref:CG-1 domain-containing protein n=1 Tax=Hippocampus comes TaxID=109280 RepID=A0A3Q2XMN0_HIPCM